MGATLLSISIILPPIGILAGLYGIYKDYSKWNIYIICIALSIAAIAYCYYPKGDPDLVRYVAYIESLRNAPLSYAMNYGVKGEGNTYVFSFFCWIAAQMDDPHIIPAISAFFVYYIGLYITCKIGFDYEIKTNDIIIYILFILITANMYSVINNIRNVFAFSVVSFAIFRDCYLKKRNWVTWVLYIFPLFVHHAAILIIGLRLLMNVVGRIKMIAFLSMILIKPIINFLYAITVRISSHNVFVNLADNFILKAYLYYNDTSSPWGLFVKNSKSFKFERIIDIFFAVIICLMIFIIDNSSSEQLLSKIIKGSRLKQIIYLPFMLALLTISCATMLTPEYWRFFTVTLMFSAIPVLVLLNYGSDNVRLFSKSVFLIAPLSFIVWIRFLFFSNVATLIFKPFISSPLLILVNGLFNWSN